MSERGRVKLRRTGDPVPHAHRGQQPQPAVAECETGACPVSADFEEMPKPQLQCKLSLFLNVGS